MPRQVSVIGAANVTVLPRAKPGAPGSPVVCHLLNGNYLPESDSMQSLKGFTVTLEDSLFRSPIVAATLLAPGREAVDCKVVRSGSAVSIIIPSLDLWALLRLDTRSAKPNQ